MNSTIIYYYYSQRDYLAKKSKKCIDDHKHYDRQSIKRFSYKDYIKIIIHQNFVLFDIKMQYILHSIWLEVSIPSKIKDYILDNINLLSWKIYKRLIKHKLDINIH